jgi:hypothetical protein
VPFTWMCLSVHDGSPTIGAVTRCLAPWRGCVMDSLSCANKPDDASPLIGRRAALSRGIGASRRPTRRFSRPAFPFAEAPSGV